MVNPNQEFYAYGVFIPNQEFIDICVSKFSSLDQSMTRKYYLNIFYMMLRTADIPGAQFFDILKKHLPAEKGIDVIEDNLSSNFSVIISSYIPVER